MTEAHHVVNSTLIVSYLGEGEKNNEETKNTSAAYPWQCGHDRALLEGEGIDRTREQIERVGQSS